MSGLGGKQNTYVSPLQDKRDIGRSAPEIKATSPVYIGVMRNAAARLCI